MALTLHTTQHVLSRHTTASSNCYHPNFILRQSSPSDRYRRTCMDAQCQAVSRGRNLLFTSEFWYEEEEEFDSLTDNLNAKRLFLLCASSDDPCEVEWARSLLNPVVMHSGFFAPSRAAVADYMWHERGGPPLFRKMRERDALTQADERDGEDADGAGIEFLDELLGMNWRTELDYGLAGARIPEWEGILVVASPSGCARIASLAANRAVAAPAPGSMLLVTVGASFPGSSGWRELPVRVDVATRDGASSMDWAFDQDAEPSFA